MDVGIYYFYLRFGLFKRLKDVILEFQIDILFWLDNFGVRIWNSLKSIVTASPVFTLSFCKNFCCSRFCSFFFYVYTVAVSVWLGRSFASTSLLTQEPCFYLKWQQKKVIYKITSHTYQCFPLIDWLLIDWLID